MKKYKPVTVSRAAFLFCRIGVAILVWLSFLFRLEAVLLLVFIIFLISVLVKIKKSPMIFFYENTINRIVKSKDEILDENAMRFAHTLGAIFSLVCLLVIYFINENIGWAIVFLFAILKSVSAFGFCPASNLYKCVGSNNCCTFLKKK